MTIQAQNNRLSTITGNNNSISKTMRSTDNKEVTFSYLPEDKIEISVKSDLSESRKVKSHDIPKDLKGLSTPSEFHAFLKNAYVKANELSNGDVKIYVSQKILGGMHRGNTQVKGDLNANHAQNIEKASGKTRANAKNGSVAIANSGNMNINVNYHNSSYSGNKSSSNRYTNDEFLRLVNNGQKPMPNNEWQKDIARNRGYY